MKILFDQNIPKRLRRSLLLHDVSTAREMGWDRFENGELLRVAEDAGFELLITGDQKLRYQQNLALRKIAIIEVSKNNWPSMEPNVSRIVAAADLAQPGSYVTIDYSYIYKPRNKSR